MQGRQSKKRAQGDPAAAPHRRKYRELVGEEAGAALKSTDNNKIDHLALKH